MVKNYKWILILLVVFIVTFLYTLFFVSISVDEIWEYGYGFNIATGLVPYRDFNMLATPLYPFLISIFINLFGHYLLSVNIFNSLVLVGIFALLYKMIKAKLLIILPFIMLFSYPTYNNLLMFFFFLLIFIKRSKIDDNKKLVYSSLIISLMFLTKQSIGFVFLVLEFFLTKEKKKYLIIASIPIACLIIYLIFNHALYNFIDYAFLGLLDFGTRNGSFNYNIVLWIYIFVISVILYIRYRKVDILYGIAYQTIAFPMFDLFHTNMAVIALLFIVLDINSKRLKTRYVILIALVLLSLFVLNNSNSNNNSSNNKIFTDNNYLFARKYDKNLMVIINETSRIIDKYNDQYDKIFSLIRYSYMVKLYRGDKLEKFDMTLNGNMGYKGYEKYIQEIDDYCKTKKCLLIIEPSPAHVFLQKNYEIIDYVQQNYYLIESNGLGYGIYTN